MGRKGRSMRRRRKEREEVSAFQKEIDSKERLGSEEG
jgi:hypothetical protein